MFSRRLTLSTSIVLASGLVLGLGSTLGAAPPAVAAVSARATHHTAKYRSLFQKAAAGEAKVSYRAGTYVVRLRAQPAATYSGGTNGFRATRPSAGHQLNARTDAVSQYRSHLQTAQQTVAAAHGIMTMYNYTLAFNGFAAKLTAAQAIALAKDPRVTGLTRNSLLKVQAATPVNDLSSLNFLKISTMGGLWDSIGGPGNAGKGIVVGDLDTGIAPENASFAGNPLGTTPGAAPYLVGNSVTFVKADGNTFLSSRVASGAGWATTDYSTKIIGAKFYDAGFGVSNIGGPAVADGARDEYLSPRDGAGHGSHTASTAAGDYGVDASVIAPSGPIDMGGISGVAPAAKIAMYKVCWDGKAADESLDGCATSDIVAGIDQAVADGVDVLNFSIGGGAALTTDSPTDEAFKAASAAGIFVAAAGGNAGPDHSTLDNAAPWETTVAASTIPTYNATIVLGDGVTLVGSSITVNSDPATQLTDVPLVLGRDIPGLGQAGSKAAQCASGSLSHTLAAGKVVVCERQGTISRADTSAAVKAAGGVGEILVNTSVDLNDLDIDPHSVPTIHISADGGLGELTTYAHSTRPTVSFLPGDLTGSASPTPQIADFSSRGPVAAGDSDVLKPDVSAPGVDILAAVANAPGADGAYEFYSGTSMATPHVTGLAALYLGVHPLAAPMDIKSSLMTTATRTVDAFGSSDVDPFAQGAGEVNPSRFLKPGLVYSSTLTDWNAYLVGTGQVNTEDAQYAGVKALDPTQLNQASISIGNFFLTKKITRTVTAQAAGTWTASAKVAGVRAIVSPATLRFTAAGQTKSFTVTFTSASSSRDNWTSGSMIWRNGSATVRSPIVIFPTTLYAPTHARGSGVDGSLRVPVTSGIRQLVDYGALGLAKGDVTDAQGPVGSQYTADATTGGHAVYQYTVAPAQPSDFFGFTGTEFLRFAVKPVGAAPNTNLDLSLYYFKTAADVPANPTLENLAPNEVADSSSPSASESIDYFTPSDDVYLNGGVYVTWVSYVSAPAGTHYAEQVFNLTDTSNDGNLVPYGNDAPEEYEGKPGVTENTKYSWEALDPYSDYLGFAITIGEEDQTMTLLDVSTQKPVNVSPPTITGVPTIGSTLTANPGTWDSAISSLSLDYQWLRDGSPIPGATTDSYDTVDADFGHAITVSVTAQFGTAGGTSTATSAAATIKAPTTTVISLSPASIRVGHSTRVSVTVTYDAALVPAGVDPLSLAGTVVVRYAGRGVTASVGASGTVTVVLPKFTKKGSHAISAVYAGNAKLLTSTSAAVTLTIS